MRQAKSYSIVDHELLHGKYLHHLSHESMVLYLFLVVVGNRDGMSFYSDKTITEILRMESDLLSNARNQLISKNLIEYKKPYWFVKNLLRSE